MTDPMIIRETNAGYSHYAIRDDMLTRREVECVGPITPESAASLIRQLRYLAHQDGAAEITLCLDSPGGDVSSGLAIYDVMQAIPCPVRTLCLGTAASMAAVLFAAGVRRDILPHGQVMIHDPLLSEGAAGSALQVRRISENLLRAREELCTILAQRTGHSLEEIYEKTASDCWFTAQEALDFGLADRILHTL